MICQIEKYLNFDVITIYTIHNPELSDFPRPDYGKGIVVKLKEKIKGSVGRELLDHILNSYKHAPFIAIGNGTDTFCIIASSCSLPVGTIVSKKKLINHKKRFWEV